MCNIFLTVGNPGPKNHVHGIPTARKKRGRAVRTCAVDAVDYELDSEFRYNPGKRISVFVKKI